MGPGELLWLGLQAEGTTMMGMVSGGLGVSVEASESAEGPEGVLGDTRPLGAVDMVGVGTYRHWSKGDRQ